MTGRTRPAMAWLPLGAPRHPTTVRRLSKVAGCARLAVTLMLAGTLGACVETGDFGRPKRSVWNDAVATTGLIVAARRGEPVSDFGFTDDEEEMHGRAWRFLEPAHERAWFERAISELVATRVAPDSSFNRDFTAYHRALLSADPRSATSSYLRLSDDVMADARLIEPFARVAARVLAADAVRLRSLAYVHELGPSDVVNAEARVAENRCLIAWVARGLDLRQRAYRYSIEHLVIETPQADGVTVERGLSVLAREKTFIDQLGVSPLEGAACAGPAEPVEAAPRRQAPLVRKG